MKLSKRNRDKTVQVLRCAADLVISHGEPFPRMEACDQLDANDAVYNATVDVLRSYVGPRDQFALLEAAALVEEGSWP